MYNYVGSTVLGYSVGGFLRISILVAHDGKIIYVGMSPEGAPIGYLVNYNDVRGRV